MAEESGSGSDGFGAGVLLGNREHGRHWTNFQVEKWDAGQIAWTLTRDYDDLRLISQGAEPLAADFARLRCCPFEVYLKEDANLITNAGWVNIMGGIAGTTPTKFVNATTGRIGLGVSATAVTAADTALGSVAGLSANNWKVINAVPTVGSGTGAGNGLILSAQFITTDANGAAIAEFAADMGTTNTNVVTAQGTFFSHGNATPGTKTSAQTWNATISYQWT
jgi:hypothetical protein